MGFFDRPPNTTFVFDRADNDFLKCGPNYVARSKLTELFLPSTLYVN
ncbi:hypothetical protein PDIG_10300 [Penicillium digitatum PHI26]|uniref:Uncharacterized protein n=1 Tax=Penicillium digitatum (strain PHI26 / CECT 20796) TaxID=1170229 RepID=K9G8Z0_PEND2|nr:hypothetical protein PDIG_10300 [Penicillium digitatum PHI26]